jgi:hypothetical protein
MSCGWRCLQVPEIEIIDVSENVCNLKKQEADWMLRIDIVEKGDKLEVSNGLSSRMSYVRRVVS